MCIIQSIIDTTMTTMNDSAQDTMMIDSTESVIIKIFSYMSTDVDEDGTRFLRGMILRKGCSCIDKFKLRCEELDDFIRTQQNNRFRILSKEGRT